MTDFSSPLPEPYYKKLAHDLYAPVLYGENSVMLCPPLHGKDHNAFQLGQRPQLVQQVYKEQAQKLLFLQFPQVSNPSQPTTNWLATFASMLAVENCQTIEQLRPALQEILEKKSLEPVITVVIPEIITKDSLKELLSLLQTVYYFAPHKIHFVLLMDVPWDYEELLRLIAPFRSLFQQTTFATQYSQQEVEHFVRYWLQRWEYALSTQVVRAIGQAAGGVLLIAKAITRCFVMHGAGTVGELESLLATDADLRFQIDFFLFALTEQQRSVLTAVANGEQIPHTSVVEQLLRWRLIRPVGTQLVLHPRALQLRLQSGGVSQSVLLQHIAAEQSLSKRERALLLVLAEKLGQVVSRDVIAEQLWQDDVDEKYSEWAIDKTVSRIRQKIEESSLLQGLQLETLKKQGFRLA